MHSFDLTDDGKAIVKLSQPVQAHGELVSVLHLRKPLMGDLLETDGVEGEIAKSLALFAKLCNVPPTTIKALGLEDGEALGQALVFLKSNAPKTPGK